MKKLNDVKSTKLLVGDRIRVAGVMHRVTSLSRNYGRKYTDRVRIHLFPLDKSGTYKILETASTARFTVRRKK